MARPKKNKEPVTLAGKVEKEMPEFYTEVVGLGIQDLKNRIATYTKELDESEEHRKANDDLKSAKAEVKELNGPYNDVKKAVHLKNKFLVSLIKEKGGL